MFANNHDDYTENITKIGLYLLAIFFSYLVYYNIYVGM